jgi:hypothetical protein
MIVGFIDSNRDELSRADLSNIAGRSEHVLRREET